MSKTNIIVKSNLFQLKPKVYNSVVFSISISIVF